MNRTDIKGSVRKINTLVFLSIFFLIIILPAAVTAQEMPKQRLNISSSFDEKNQVKISRGGFYVWENRELKKGKVIKLDFVILHARGKNPSPHPLFVLAGGPGVAATIYESSMKKSGLLKTRDIVMVALRGTGGDNRLWLDPNRDKGAQGYFDSVFDMEYIKNLCDTFASRFDLTQYSNQIAADDLDEIRQALGYRKVNLMGTSGGTRMAIVYMKQHPASVRAAILIGVVSYEFKNPLFHASAAQKSLEKLFTECRENPETNKAYPDLEKEFYAILHKLKNKPVKVTIKDPATKEPAEILMGRGDFADAVRFMLYTVAGNRRLPHLIHQAYLGKYEPFAQLRAANARGLNRMLSMGLLLCVTCAEDVDRITEEEIVKETSGTFLGDTRVRAQKAACAIWPRSKISADYTSPLKTIIPVLLLSGTLDPVTPPRFAEMLHQQLNNSLHLVVPGAHGVGGKCIRTIQQKFLETASIKGLDTSCTKTITLLPIYIPKESSKSDKR